MSKVGNTGSEVLHQPKEGENFFFGDWRSERLQMLSETKVELGDNRKPRYLT